MATYNKFETFADTDLPGAVHDLFGSTPGTDCDQCDIYLSNTAPSASADSVKTDLAEIATGNGYSGPQAVPNQTASASSGTFTLAGDEITITASGGAIATFQYVVLMNDGTTVKTDPLIAWWDNGSTIDLADGESFTWQPSGQASGGTIFTLS